MILKPKVAVTRMGVSSRAEHGIKCGHEEMWAKLWTKAQNWQSRTWTKLTRKDKRQHNMGKEWWTAVNMDRQGKLQTRKQTRREVQNTGIHCQELASAACGCQVAKKRRLTLNECMCDRWQREGTRGGAKTVCDRAGNCEKHGLRKQKYEFKGNPELNCDNCVIEFLEVWASSPKCFN